ncbi:unnamed protein product, partial [Iphiclides podalirius]
MRHSLPIPFSRSARQSLLRTRRRHHAADAFATKTTLSAMIADLPPLRTMENQPNSEQQGIKLALAYRTGRILAADMRS